MLKIPNARKCKWFPKLKFLYIFKVKMDVVYINL